MIISFTHTCTKNTRKENFLVGSLLIIVAEDMFYLEDYCIQLYLYLFRISDETFEKTSFLKKIILRERGREGEREGEKHHCEREALIGCVIPPTEVPAHNPGMCCDLSVGTQSTEPHQPGQKDLY